MSELGVEPLDEATLLEEQIPRGVNASDAEFNREYVSPLSL